MVLMKKKCLFPFILILSLMLSGCGQKAQDFSLERLENDGSGRETTQKIREELVSEAEGGDVDISGTEEISASGSTPEDIEGNAAASSAADGQSGETDTPVVYMTTDISSDGLMTIYQALAASPSGKIAVKLSTGEPGSNYIRTDLIGELVQTLEGTIVECNTAYGGSRANTAMHYQVAEDHGYTAIADVDIMDEDGSMTLPVTGGDNLTENYVGAHFADYDYYVVLSHFKGHAMAGFGGAIKNISIGIASSEGKSHIHSGGTGGSMWGGDQNAFLESMAEAGKSVVDYLDGKILYINVMNRLSVDCDCDGSPAEPKPLWAMESHIYKSVCWGVWA